MLRRAREDCDRGELLSLKHDSADVAAQQKWRLLEDRIQKVAAARGELWAITGPFFEDDDGDGIIKYMMGEVQFAVSTHYFKVVYWKNRQGKWEASVSSFPNQKVTEDFDDFLASIDEVEG